MIYHCRASVCGFLYRHPICWILFSVFCYAFTNRRQGILSTYLQQQMFLFINCDLGVVDDVTNGVHGNDWWQVARRYSKSNFHCLFGVQKVMYCVKFNLTRLQLCRNLMEIVLSLHFGGNSNIGFILKFPEYSRTSQNYYLVSSKEEFIVKPEKEKNLFIYLLKIFNHLFIWHIVRNCLI